MRKAILAQPEWLRAGADRPAAAARARVLYTGCGTSFHAAQTGGAAVQALELVLAPERRRTCSSPSATKATRR